MLSQRERRAARSKSALASVYDCLPALTLSIVAATACAPQDELRERWALIPELRIGSIDTPHYAFGRISGLAVAAGESMYVADVRAVRSRVRRAGRSP